MTVRRAMVTALIVAGLAATPGCLPGTAVYRANLVVPYEALPNPDGSDECFVGVNLESNLGSYVEQTYPEEEWQDQYRSRLLARLDAIEPGEEYVGSVSYTVTVAGLSIDRSTSHPISLVDTCSSTRGAYRCTLPTSHGLSETVTCALSPFFATELRPEDGPPQLEIDYTVEACRAGSCEGGWVLRVHALRHVAKD